MKNKYIDLIQRVLIFRRKKVLRVEDGELLFCDIPVMNLIQQYGTPLFTTCPR